LKHAQHSFNIEKSELETLAEIFFKATHTSCTTSMEGWNLLTTSIIQISNLLKKGNDNNLYLHSGQRFKRFAGLMLRNARLALREFSEIGRRGNKPQKVAIGLSGGVDSAVAALLLKRAGFDVIGVHMSNWNDEDDSLTDSYRTCEGADALKYAKLNALKLGIPLHRVSFEQEYWNQVFEPSLQVFKSGVSTPNPDTLCNNVIKFDHFVKYVREKFGVDWIATGHYARIADGDDGLRLLRGVDHEKDQTYFLSSVERHKFEKILFPLGVFSKEQVRKIAQEEDLPSANRKSSAGLCFVGKKKRNFVQFLSDYMPESDIRGPILDWRTKKAVGEHNGLWTMTIGQRTRIGGQLVPSYVICKDAVRNYIYVTTDKSDPALFSDTVILKDFNLISPEFPSDSTIQIKERHPCHGLSNGAFQLLQNGNLILQSSKLLESLAPGQAMTIYKDEECIGGGNIQASTNLQAFAGKDFKRLPEPLLEAYTHVTKHVSSHYINTNTTASSQ
jgi:tRNA-specific 2-thiouridylase